MTSKANKAKISPKTITTIFKMFLKNEKLYLLIQAFKTIIASIIPLIFVFIPPLIINELLGDRSTNKLLFLVIGIAVAYFVLGAIFSACEYYTSKTAERINREFELKIAQKAMDLPFYVMESTEQIDNLRAAREGLNRIGGVCTLVNQVFDFIKNLFTIIASVLVVLSLDIVLILIVVASIIINTLVQSKLKKIDMEYWNSMVGYNARFFYIISVIMNRRYAKDIRIYDAKHVFISQMNEFISYIKTEFGKKASRQSRCNIFAFTADALQQGLIYGYLAWKLLGGAITLAGFTMYIGAVSAFTAAAINGMKAFMDILQSKNFVSYSLKFLQTTSRAIGEKSVDSVEAPCLEFKNVSFKYPGQEKYTLHNISLKIPYKQKLCIVGMNGAGKTTIIKLLLRFYLPTEGEILINGININEYNFYEYIKLFSAVFQDFKLLSASVRENIVIDASESSNYIDECLEKAGLLPRIERMEKRDETQVSKLFDPDGIDLSGGEAQKLAIARALYKKASILILDEPTAALDPKMEHEIFAHFHSMVKDRTGIYISHRMTSCLYSDVIAVLHEGRLVQYGAHDELIKLDGKYSELFKTQAQNYL